MKVLNVHERRLAATPDAVGELIDSLASSDDRLWPRKAWPSMRGFHGTHRYEREAVEGAVVLAHVLEMETRGLATVTWPIFYRPLHDALIEDSLAVAQRSLRLAPERHPWSVRVRALRRIVGRGRARSQSELFA
jgi:hypothetical protein